MTDKNIYYNIPEELRIRKQWICWRYRYDSPDVKPVKEPINPYTGNLASVNLPATHSTFEEAVAASHLYDGIGYVIRKDDPFACIDLDPLQKINQRQKEVVLPFALKAVEILQKDYKNHN